MHGQSSANVPAPDSKPGALTHSARRVKCGICRKALVKAGRGGPQAGSIDAADIKLCDGCHCGFHSRCARLAVAAAVELVLAKDAGLGLLEQQGLRGSGHFILQCAPCT